MLRALLTALLGLALWVEHPATASFWTEYVCPSDGNAACAPIRNDPVRVLRRARRSYAIRSRNARLSGLSDIPTAHGDDRPAIPPFRHRLDLDPNTLWRNANCSDRSAAMGSSGSGAGAEATADAACRWQIVIWGEYGVDIEHDAYGGGSGSGSERDSAPTAGSCDVDIFLDPTADLLALSAAGFPEPTVWWNPSEQALHNLPHDSPVLLLAHTTDDDYEEHSYDDAFFRLRSFRPIPPLDAVPFDAHDAHTRAHDSGAMDARYRRSGGDVFLWGWPEPFPWLDASAPVGTTLPPGASLGSGTGVGKGLWVPPRSRIESLYPFRYHSLVVLATCYSRAWSGSPRDATSTDPAGAVAAHPRGRFDPLLTMSLPSSRRRRKQQPAEPDIPVLPVLRPPNPVLTVGIAKGQYYVDTEPNGRSKPFPPLLEVFRAYARLLADPNAPSHSEPPATASASTRAAAPTVTAGASALPSLAPAPHDSAGSDGGDDDEYEYDYEYDSDESGLPPNDNSADADTHPSDAPAATSSSDTSGSHSEVEAPPVERPHNDTTYSIGEFNYDLQSEIEYLRSQVAVYWEHEWAALRRFGFHFDANGATDCAATAPASAPACSSPGSPPSAPKRIDILDLGCGPGWFALRLLTALPAHVHVTCIDVNADLLAHARTHPPLAAHIASGRLTVRQDSALTLASATDASFDWVITRFLLQHLPEWPRAVATIHRVLRPRGHFAALESVSNDLVLPRLKRVDSLARVFSDYRERFHRRGGAPGDGGVMDLQTRLVPELQHSSQRWTAIGVAGVVTSSQTHSGGIDAYLPLLDPRQFYGLVRAEWATASDVAAARAQWNDALATRKSEFVMIGYSLMFSAVKADINK